MSTGIEQSNAASRALGLQNSQLTRSKRDRLRGDVFGEITTICGRLGVPNTTSSRAQSLYKQFDDRTAKRTSHKASALAAASVFLALRREGIPRTLKELCGVATNTTKKKIQRAFTTIADALGGETGVVTTDHLVARFVSRLDIPYATGQVAAYVARRAVDLSLANSRVPTTVAATAIYMTMQHTPTPLTPAQVSDETGAAASTILGAYRDIVDREADLFPVDFWKGVLERREQAKQDKTKK